MEEEASCALSAFCIDVVTAFDAVHPRVLGDCLPECGACMFSAAAAVREELFLGSRPMLNSCAFETVEIKPSCAL